jgi:glycosyltransferase involved in cell wall biosynthesis
VTAPALPHTLPDVDVVIATRDRLEMLREAIDAVLAQEYPGRITVLAVFDHSEVQQSFAQEGTNRAVRVMSNARRPGLAGSRNTGLLASDAPYVAFCDDDDLWLQGKLTAQVESLLAEPSAGLASCGIQVRYGETLTPRELADQRIDLHDLLRSRLMELHPSTFVMPRAAVVDGFGLVEEEIPGSYAEDYEFLLRAAKYGPVLNVPMVGTEVLWHQNSFFTSRWSTIREALVWLLERYPEFQEVPRGLARITGQLAFANAALGQRREALHWVWRTVRTSPREMRAYLALAVCTRLVGADRIVRTLQKRGRGI